MVGDWQESTAIQRDWPIPSPLSKNFDDSNPENVPEDHKSRPRHTSGLGTSPYTSLPLSSEEQIKQLEQRTTFPTGETLHKNAHCYKTTNILTRP